MVGKFTSLAFLGLAIAPICSSAAPKETPLMVNPAVSSSSGAPASGVVSRGSSENLTVRVRNSCFGTNLRGVGNPLAPSSIIHAELVVKMGSKEIPLKFQYPAMLVTAEGMTSDSKTEAIKPEVTKLFTMPADSVASIYGNTLQILIPKANEYKVSVDLSGEKSETGTLNKGGVSLKSYKFIQEVTDCSGPGVYGAYGHSRTHPAYPCGAYMGKNGPLSANISGVSVSNNNTVIEISASFPGQTGFCGGYYSPLMLFFSDKRPDFTNVVKYPVGPAEKAHWPSGSSEYALLALDRNGDGKITEKNELFGDQEALINGFEMLKFFDENQDGFIDEKDKDYKNLLLWYDNGDGVSTPEELVPLASKVAKISLTYKTKTRPLGQFAEERETADFWMKKGKKKGKVIDVWFAPATK